MPKRASKENHDGAGREFSFEEALHRLEAIVSQLEAGEAPLDSALKLYEEGVALSRLCSQRLRDAERRVELLEDKNGEMRAVPFLDRARREELGLESAGSETAGEEAEDEDAEDDDEAEEETDESEKFPETDSERKSRSTHRDTLF